MSPEQRSQLTALIVATSMYYGQQLPDSVIRLYVEDLEDLPFERIVWAIREARRDPKTTRFPLPAIIRDKVMPADLSDGECLIASGRIIGAVSAIGPYEPARAREYIGELGWEIVKLEGGWEEVCQKLTYDNEATLKAQWRNTAKAVVQRMRAGVSSAPALPSSNQNKLTSFGNLLPAMPKEGA